MFWAKFQTNCTNEVDVVDERDLSLTHRGRVTRICISKISIIGSDNGLSPGRRQAIIWANAAILLIWHLGINFSEILIEINTFSLKKMHLKLSSAKWRLFRLGLNELRLMSSVPKKADKLISLSLSRQVISHDRQNKHHFVKTVTDKCYNWCVFSKTSPVLICRFHCIRLPVQHSMGSQ